MKYKALAAQLFCLLVFVPQLAFAYIDPGTGATFVGSLGPILVGIVGGAFAMFIKFFWHPIRRLFSKGESTDQQDETSE